MKPITGTGLCRVLEGHVKGSHHIFSKQGEPKIIAVPVHAKKYVKLGLATRIGKDANVSW